MAAVGNKRGCGFGEEMGSEGHRCSQRRCVFGEFVNKARHLGAERGGEIDGSETAPSRSDSPLGGFEKLDLLWRFWLCRKGFHFELEKGDYTGCESLEQERCDDVVW